LRDKGEDVWRDDKGVYREHGYKYSHK
jgi:hypothetical protein